MAHPKGKNASSSSSSSTDWPGTFCYIELIQMATSQTERRVIPWPGLLLPRDGPTLAAFPEQIQRRIRGMDVNKIFRETILVLTNNNSTNNHSTNGVTNGNDNNVHHPDIMFGAMFLFGSPPIGLNMVRYVPSKVMGDENDIPIQAATERNQDIMGYTEAMEDAAWYASSEVGAGPPGRHDDENNDDDDDDDDSMEESEDEDDESEEEESEEDEGDEGIEVEGAARADCLCVRGGASIYLKHPGNMAFRRVIGRFHKLARRSANKVPIVQQVLDEFAKTGGRIVKPESGNDFSKEFLPSKWVEIDDEAKYRKIIDAMYSYKPKRRDQIDNDTRSLVRTNKKRSRHTPARLGSTETGTQRKKKRQRRNEQEESSNDELEDDDDDDDDEDDENDLDSNSSVEEVRNTGKALSKPRTRDCACVHGWTNHPGNERFKGIVDKCVKSFGLANTRAERGRVINKIMAKFGENGARFLRPSDGSATTWIDIDRDAARKKVSTALSHLLSTPSDVDESDDEETDDGSSSGDEFGKLRDKDCACNVGSQWADHPGNKRFMSIVGHYASAYHQAEGRNARGQVIGEIFDKFVRHGGRFVRPNEVQGSWVEIERKPARKKIGNALMRWKKLEETKVSEEEDVDTEDSDDDSSLKSVVDQGTGKTKATEADCVCSKPTRDQVDWPGTLNFRDVVERYAARYKVAMAKDDGDDKMKLVKMVFNAFLKTGGRFIKPDGKSFVIANKSIIVDKIRHALAREAKNAPVPKRGAQKKKERTSLKRSDSENMETDDYSYTYQNNEHAHLPLFKRLKEEGELEFLYKAFRYSHVELIPDFEDVRDSLEAAGHVFSDNTFTFPDGRIYTSEAEYRAQMCLGGVPVRGVRPRDAKENPDYQIVMAWVCYTRLEALNDNNKDVSKIQMEEEDFSHLLTRLEEEDDEEDYFKDVELLARRGVPLEAVKAHNLSKQEHMQLERYYSCPYSRSLHKNAIFFYKA